MTRDLNWAMPDPRMVTNARPLLVSGIPEAARRLIWDTFFVEAGRGIDFTTHLPWHIDLTSQTLMLVDENETALAVAVVRPARQAGVAMVGYVCVAEAARGQGHGRALICATNASIDAAGYRATLLWTGQPEIYARQGYRIVAREDFLNVTRLSTVSASISAGDIIASVWPGSDDSAGLPAFATTARRLSNERSEAIVAIGSRGATLIAWEGAVDDVVAILDASGYATWNVNVPAGDNFREALPAGQFDVKKKPGAVVMVRCADPLFVPTPVPVADRI